MSFIPGLFLRIASSDSTGLETAGYRRRLGEFGVAWFSWLVLPESPCRDSMTPRGMQPGFRGFALQPFSVAKMLSSGRFARPSGVEVRIVKGLRKLPAHV